MLWAWLARHWARWREVLIFVQPATVLAGQRTRFREHWARLSRRHAGRPAITQNIRELIREISEANPRWGSPRILGEGHLRRLLTHYIHYYHHWRTHLSLAMECPDTRPVQPPEQGAVVAFPEVGGLHHHYERMAA